MGKRGTITDYAGEALYPGDLITYGTRRGNRVRMSDAVILECTTKRIGWYVVPRLLVQPTGTDSGYGLTRERKSLRRTRISPEHARLIRSQVMPTVTRVTPEGAP